MHQTLLGAHRRLISSKISRYNTLCMCFLQSIKTQKHIASSHVSHHDCIHVRHAFFFFFENKMQSLPEAHIICAVKYCDVSVTHWFASMNVTSTPCTIVAVSRGIGCKYFPSTRIFFSTKFAVSCQHNRQTQIYLGRRLVVPIVTIKCACI